MNIENAFERLKILLEDEEWEKAKRLCDELLDEDAHCAMAYLGRLMAIYNISSIENWKVIPDLKNNDYFKRAIEFADDELKKILNSIADKNSVSTPINYDNNNASINKNKPINHGDGKTGINKNKHLIIAAIVALIIGLFYFVMSSGGPRYEDAKKFALRSGGRIINSGATYITFEIPRLNIEAITFCFKGKRISDNPPVAGCRVLLRWGLRISEESIRLTQKYFEENNALPKGLEIREALIIGSSAFDIGDTRF